MKWLKLIMLLCLIQVIIGDRRCTGRILLDQLSNETRIEIGVNTTLTLECRLDHQAIRNGCKASNLSYLIGSTTHARDGLFYSNDSLLLTVNTSRPDSQTIQCTYNNVELYGSTVVNIDVVRQIISLNCVNIKLLKLDCTYKMPTDGVKQTIKIEKLGRNGSYQMVQPHYNNESKNYSFQIFDRFKPFDQISFRVSVNGTNGHTRHDDIIFKPDEIVVLPNPFRIEIKKLTSEIARVTWKLPIIYNEYRFNHTQYLNRIKTNLERVTTRIDFAHIIFELDVRLPYAYTNYTLVITTCIANTSSCEKPKSRGKILFQSKTRIPDAPPIIDDAFEYDENNNVKIYWKMPETNLQNADNYTVKLQKILTNGTVVDNIKSTMFKTGTTLHDLDPHNEYEIRLIAENSVGKSKTFSSLTIPTRTSIGRIGRTFVQTITNNSIEIFWTPPKNWPNPILDYNVSYVLYNKSELYSHKVTKNTTILDNLRSSSRYLINVSACNNQLCSPIGEQIGVTTYTGVPEKIRSIVLHDNDCVYEWSPPHKTNGEFLVYEIQIEVTISGINKTQNSLTLESRCTLDKYLDRYSVSIRAININESINPNMFNHKSKHSNCFENLNTNYTELCSKYDCIPGSWEIKLNESCVHSNALTIVWYMVIALIIIGIICLAMYIHHWYIDVTNIHASFPIGLNFH